MNDDYLWDRSGPPDADVARLERLLRPLGHHATTAPTGALADAASDPHPIRPRLPFLLAASVLLAAIAGLLSTVPREAGRDPWLVGRVEGTPLISSRPMGDRGRLGVGDLLETGASAKARIDIADIGYVEVEPGTRVQLLHSQSDLHRLRLERGTLHASIFAPPGRFVVDTPSATAVDLGCAYTLQVDERGSGRVHVTSGWVAFEWRGRESLIPAGAMCETRPEIGPGTPYDPTAPAAFRAALETIDFRSPQDPDRAQALAYVLEEASARDAVTLWHLLSRVTSDERMRVYDRLSSLVPPPDGVTPTGIVGGDRAMLDLWWGELGFGDAASWRQWKDNAARPR